MSSFLSQIDMLENNNVSAIKHSATILGLNNNPFDVGKAIEVLYKALSIEFPKEFSDRDLHPMKTNPKDHLPIIIEKMKANNSDDLSETLDKLRQIK